MSKEQHTPLQHTPNCVVIGECQNNHMLAKDTGQPLPTHPELEVANTKGKCAINASNAEQKMSSKIGKGSNLPLLQHMAEDVPAVANLILLFLQSITLTEMVESIERQELGDISSINGWLTGDTRKTAIDCFASTVTALAVSSESVPTKLNARLIASAPELLDALEKLVALGNDLKPHSFVWDDVHAAIAKAKGE